MTTHARVSKFFLASIFLLVLAWFPACDFIDGRLRDFADIQSSGDEGADADRCEILYNLGFGDCQVPENTIVVVVTGGDQPVGGYTLDQPARSLMAITDRVLVDPATYEGTRENILLGPYQDNYTWIGALELTDPKGDNHTIIVYDDSFVTPYLIGGQILDSATTHNYGSIKTAETFSPCRGIVIGTAPIFDHFGLTEDTVTSLTLTKNDYLINAGPNYSGERWAKFTGITGGEYLKLDFVDDMSFGDPSVYCSCTTAHFNYLTGDGSQQSLPQPILDPAALGLDGSCPVISGF